VGQDMAFQRQEWKVQRLGWVLLSIFLFLAALGVFGSGAVATTSVSTGDYNQLSAR